VDGMGILLESVKHRKKINCRGPLEIKRQIVLDEIKALNVTVSRSGKPLESLDYDQLKEEWAIASILWADTENPENKWF
jgi:hypothetical protein